MSFCCWMFASFRTGQRGCSKTFTRDDRGATAIEYGLIAGILATAIIAGASQIDPRFAEVGNKFETAVATTEN